MNGWVGNPLVITQAGRLTATPCLESNQTVFLEQNHVHVWFTRSSEFSSSLDMFIRTLNRAESLKMSRFATEYLRVRFAYAHGLLRLLLSRYADCLPEELVFSEGSHGKPVLVGTKGLSFSLSHSGEGIAIAVARDLDIGVDIEEIKPIEDRAGLVERFFSSNEICCYKALPPSMQETAFFRLWTRKEAFVKGLGLGLSHPLDSFSVGLDVPVSLAGRDSADWSLHHLEPGHGFAGALAVRSHQATLSGGFLQLTGLNVQAADEQKKADK
jgi:4'-phosphopantetheinyl transferase